MENIKQIRQKLNQLVNIDRAVHSKSYLKSPYLFYGANVPQLRQIAKEYKSLEKYEIYNLFDELWNSGNHEEMSLALYLLGNLKSKKKEQNNLSVETWDFLMRGDKPRIIKACSWDHIDEISSHITGEIFLNNPQLQSEIKQLSDSKNPWLRRLSIVSQYPLIKKGKIQLTILLAEKLVYDENIYVQKGAGWMLREAGKKNRVQVQEFIKIHKNMKPFAFSYATEKMLELRKRLKEEIKNERIEGKTKIFEENDKPEEVKEKLPLNLEKIKYFKN